MYFFLDSVYMLSLLAIICIGLAIANRLTTTTHHTMRMAMLSPLFAAVLALIEYLGGHHTISGWPAVLATLPLVVLYTILLRELRGEITIRYQSGSGRARIELMRRRTDRESSATHQ